MENLAGQGEAAPGSLIESKRAAAQVEEIPAARETFAKVFSHAAPHVFAAPLGFENTRFAEDANVFGHVVLRDFDAFHQLSHGQRLAQEFTHNAPARFVGQRLQHGDALLARHAARITSL